MIELFGFLGGFLTTASMIPQLWLLFKLKKADEISMTFSVAFTAGIFFWLLYGILLNLYQIIVWNSIALGLGAGIVYAKWRWGK